LVKQSLQHPQRRKKKDFIESLRHKRLLCLERAATYEELILELGGEIEEPMIDEMAGEGSQRRIRSQDEEEDEELPSSSRRKRSQDENEDSQGRQNGSQNRTDGRGRVTSPDDGRLKENESEQLRAARHMEGGDDGRGEVRSEDDKRLKENETDALSRARHQGGDGRGQVKSEDDGRLKGNESESMSRARHMEHAKAGAGKGGRSRKSGQGQEDDE
jgi:hypothetical protein